MRKIIGIIGLQVVKNRSGSYKKIIFSSEELEQNEEQIKGPLALLLAMYKENKISDVDFTCLYLILFLRLKHPKNYLQRHQYTNNENDQPYLLDLIPKNFSLSEFEKGKLKDVTGLQLFLDFNLKGIPKSVHRAMINWYQKNWDLILTFKIPNSKELLKQQAKNKRIVTLIVDDKRILTHILGKRDPLSFALHDLMHADQFFNHPESVKGQLGFYSFIDQHSEHIELNNLIKVNPNFKEEYEYVISDMNAYIIHLLKSFKSCFTRADAEPILINFLIDSQLPEEILTRIMNLNNNELQNEDELILKNYFESKQDFVL